MFESRAWVKGRLKSRAAMDRAERIAGPALLEDPTSTLLVPKAGPPTRQADNTILRISKGSGDRHARARRKNEDQGETGEGQARHETPAAPPSSIPSTMP